MKLQEDIQRIKEVMGLLVEKQNEPLIFVYNPKTNDIVGYNLVYDTNEFNETVYDENGDSRGYGWGTQVDDQKKTLVFDSKEDAQNWSDSRNEKHLVKTTQNKNYPNLSSIALQLRKLKDVDYQIINRGSCFKFAKEIGELGYNDFTFIFSEDDQAVIHVYIKLNGNLYWDALGFHKKSDVVRVYEIGEDYYMYDGDISELNNYCNIDTYSSLTTIPISNDEWEKIIRIIKSVK